MTTSEQTLRAHDYVRAIAPYQGGKPIEELARELGLVPESIIKLASNENPLGMPESARAAIARATELGRYPDGNGFELKKALSARLGVPLDWITLGNGSNDILELAAGATLAPGTSAVYAQHSFAVYALATQARGGRAIVVPARNYGHDLDAMATAIAPDTRIVFVANPNNPTGTFLEHERVARFIEKVPRNVLLVLDEAYNEYLPPELRSDTTAWVRKYPNLLIARTFSKIYGLAGLRVGYGIAQAELTDLLNRLRQPFNVNSLAQVAALAALEDKAFTEKSYEVNRRGMHQLVDGFAALGLETVPSRGNFVLVKVGAAGKVYQALLERGVIVRPVANYGLPEWLRVTIGLPEENARLLQVLPEALAAARG
jgi:histidinol-phosphate aminotransferase